MAHYLFITAGVVSHLNRVICLGTLLRDHGHRVTYASAHPAAAGRIEAHGFDFRPLRTPRQFVRSPGGLKDWRANVKREAGTAAKVLDSMEMSELAAELAPDLLLIDYELHTLIIRALTEDRRLMLLEYECSPLRTGHVPAPSSGLIPTGAAFNRLRIAGSWWRESLKRRLRFALSRVYYLGHDHWSTIRRLARRTGFDLRRNTSRRHWHYLTYPNVPTLYLSPWEFDFPNPNPNPNRAFHVGPMVMATRHEDAVDPEYERLITRLEKGPRTRERPLIYCAMGSILTDTDYYHRVIEAARMHPEWDLVIAAGRGARRLDISGAPANVHVMGFVPQLDILGRADLMLTHAGSGSVFECLAQGVPMLCYSGGAKEQDGNAARIVFHGLGARGDPLRDDPATIAARIQSLLSDPGFRRRVGELRETLRVYEQTDRVVGLLERAIADSPAGLGWRTVR